MSSPVILAIDQGTTSSRAVVYDAATFQPLASAQQEIQQHYPRDGWVEHEPEDIWYSVARTVREALTKAGRDVAGVAAIGITNQRETVVVWDRASGRPAHCAVVWQDRRTTDFCRDHAGDQPMLTAKTGLVLDPYFSATKLRWILENDPAIRRDAEAGKLACGTIDSFLIWRLSGGESCHGRNQRQPHTALQHSLDAMGRRVARLLRGAAPVAGSSAKHAEFGVTKGLDFLPDGIPIRGVAGDQQAALFGQGCFGTGEGKCTYGTGAFFLLHTGDTAVASRHNLLTTIAASSSAKPKYALEGAVFVAGAAVQWLRDGLHLFATAADVERLARASNPAEGVIFVPGLVGLGAPHWVPEARGVILGLTRATTAADLGRAALEGVAFQVADLIDAAEKDQASGGRQSPGSVLKVDGGMSANDWFLQFQADVLGRPVARAAYSESTALGAAFLAAVGTGLADEKKLGSVVATSAAHFEPKMPAAEREAKLSAWRKAVKAVIAFYGS